MNGKKYKDQYNYKKTISLCLFCDGTPLVRSKNLSLWVMFASIMELPQKVRESKNNTIVASFLVGEMDINLWFNRVFVKRTKILKSQNTIDGYSVRLFCAIFDLPARAKALCMVGHTGYDACINCLTHGVYANKVVYPFSSMITLRTQNSFDETSNTIKLANELNQHKRKKNDKTSKIIVLGIKGRGKVLHQYIKTSKHQN
jgi:hypothetical protein